MSLTHSWRTTTGDDTNDNGPTTTAAPRSHADRRPADAPATSGDATPTRLDADPWSVASAPMTLHTNAEQQRTTNGNPWRPTAGAAATSPRYAPGRQPPTKSANRRPTHIVHHHPRRRPYLSLTATTAQSAVARPIFGIVIGDSDLLPPRFNGDADDWAQDFCDYVALHRISPTDTALLLRTRMTGAARTWLEGVPADVPLDDAIARFRQRFSAGDLCRPELMTEFWERRQGPDEKTCRYIEDKARLTRRMHVQDEQFVIQGTIQGMRADARRDVLTSQTPAPEPEEASHTAMRPP